MNNQQQPYLIPLAIIVAGTLVAGGIFFGGTTGKTGNSAGALGAMPKPSIELADVSASDRILGNPNADIIIVEYSDTQCPFCKQFHNTMHQTIDTYGKDGKVAWVYRHFPIDQLHSKARKEAEASECAAEQGGNDSFWKYIDQVYKRTASNDKLDTAELPKIAKDNGLDVTAFNTCLTSGRTAARVEEQYQDAVKAGGRGTPYSIFVSNKKLDKGIIEFAAKANTAFGATPGNEVIVVSDDMKKVSMSGALPLSFIKDLIATMQK